MLLEVKAYADALTAEGVRATLDPKDVSPPCALLTVTDLTPDNADPDGSATATLSVVLVAPGPDDLSARSWLWDHAAEAAGRVFGAAPLTFDTYGAAMLPCLTLTATLGVTPWP